MRVALIQSEARLDRNSLSIARALRQQGHEAIFVTPSPTTAATSSAPEFPVDPGLAAARALSDLVTAFDVAWFFERHWAMPALRVRRFRDRLLPLVVLDAEPDPDPIPASLEEINRASAQRYALRWADAVLNGDANDAEESVRRVQELLNERLTTPARAMRRPLTSPAVTVCIPYFEAPEFLPEALQSLARQTSADFTVVVVDDGSYTEHGRSVFDACAERYASRGWTFVRQTNQSAGAARNRAAREATTEFLLFIDADDIAMPAMVERFLRAALLTDDDCLVVPNYGFRDDPEGPCALLYNPPGNSLIGSMGDDMHGGSCIIVRRESFWSIGGFSEIRGVGFEDYEFHVRCNLEGLRWDVLPEFIYRYRMPGAGNVSRSTTRYANQARVLRWYEERLRASGLGQLPLAFAGVFQRHERAIEEAGRLRNILAKRLPKGSPAPRKLRLLLLTCHFPYGMISGWHWRVQEMIRYFGARYELTLVTSMARKENALGSSEAFRWLKAVRGVADCLKSAAGVDLPYRVRRHYTDTFRAALQALPTSQYDAALIDQIFMAEFRHDIETVTVLTEHNIESQLLRQAAERSWKDALPEDWRNPRREAGLLEQYENRAWPDFPLRAVCSDMDRAQMDSRAKRGNTVVVANGANPSSWIPDVRHGSATVLFPAHLAYPPNVDGVEFLLTQIWPKVRKRTSGARLILAGRDPSPCVRAAAAAASSVELCVNPKSMQRVARRASITVVPLRLGSGTRHKILESMAWGLPVVSTKLGAEGIDAADGEHLLIRDDPDEFAEAIARLMSDEALWRKLRDAGRELVRERYSWDRVFQPLDDALVELVS